MRALRASDTQAAAPAHVHAVHAQAVPHAHCAAASFRTSCVAVPQVQGVQLQEVQVQEEVVSVVMASLGAGMVTRRSGVSGLRTHELCVR